MRPKVIFENVSKTYNLYAKQSDKLKNLLSSNKNVEDFHALKNVNFTIYEGEIVGVVGLNGAGKSTLSNLMAQINPPTSGTITINGETSLIAIAVGLNNQLSGIENIRLKCLMHGMSNSKIEDLLPSIIEFADIGNFINQPVKNYSAGMKSKLGFAISVHTDPDILIIDEALSVGDQTFYQKCIDKMNEFKRSGRTIIFISHSISQVKSFCDKVIWLNYGQVEMYDEVNLVINKYQEFVKWFNNLSESEKKAYRHEKLNSQYKYEEYEMSRVKRQVKGPKLRIGIGFYSQLLVLSTILAIMIVLMFNQTYNFINLSNIDNQFFSKQELVKGELGESESDSSVGESTNDMNVQAETINQPAYINVESASILKSIDDDLEITELSFGFELFILEKVESYYKFMINDVEYFINEEDVVFVNTPISNSLASVDSLVSIFPENFANSYMYFLSFLGASENGISSTIFVSPEEDINYFGEKYLNYSTYSIGYVLGQDNISYALKINDINTSMIESLGLSEFEISDGVYYINTTNYEVLINEELEQMLIKEI